MSRARLDAGQDLVARLRKEQALYKRCMPVLTRYVGCGVCMKVCPIQKYGMKNVMEHYVETGQVLGKGTHDLEGYTLEGKGYFGPGELPVFDRDFFSSMPTGNSASGRSRISRKRRWPRAAP